MVVPTSLSKQSIKIEDVGNLAAFLVIDAAASLTGNTEYIDAGFYAVANRGTARIEWRRNNGAH
jgi:enoyl-[acyl-carrier-protein] reductase (NADH)